MPKKMPTNEQKAWIKLTRLIEQYADAKIADSWKGGGDPLSVPTIEAELEVARARLNEQLGILQRIYQ